MSIDLSVVLTSAAVSALVSGLFTFVSQWMERRARQREFLLKTAADWATKQQEAAFTFAKTSGRRVTIPPLPVFAYEYHRQLSSLFQSGKLTPEEQQHYEEWSKTADPSRGQGGEP